MAGERAVRISGGRLVLTSIPTTGGGATTAVNVSVVPVGNLTSTDVQAALAEVQGDVDALTGGATVHAGDSTPDNSVGADGDWWVNIQPGAQPLFYGKKVGGAYPVTPTTPPTAGSSTTVVDGLVSTSATDALSANQGRALDVRLDIIEAAPPGTSPAVATPAAPAPAGAVGTGTRYAREDHVHPSDAPAAGASAAVAPGTASPGVSAAFAREDHVHPSDAPLPGAATPVVDGTAAVGTSTAFAREDHVHPAQPVPAAGTTTPTAPAAAGAVGVSADFSRADHIHPVDGVSADANNVLTAGTDGRAHLPSTSIPAGSTKSAIVPPAATDATGAVGTDTAFAGGDHKHPAQAPSADVGNLLKAGTDGLTVLEAADLPLTPRSAVLPLASDDAGGAAGTSTDVSPGDHKHPAQAPSADVGNVLKAGTDGLHLLDPADLPAGSMLATAVSPAPTDATGLVGTATSSAREDHKHPEAGVSADARQLLKPGTDGLHLLDSQDLPKFDSATQLNRGVVHTPGGLDDTEPLGLTEQGLFQAFRFSLLWGAAVTYNTFSTPIAYNGSWWVSRIDNNTGNVPSVQSTAWKTAEASEFNGVSSLAPVVAQNGAFYAIGEGATLQLPDNPAIGFNFGIRNLGDVATTPGTITPLNAAHTIGVLAAGVSRPVDTNLDAGEAISFAWTGAGWTETPITVPDVPAAADAEYASKLAGEVVDLGRINRYPAAHVFSIALEAPTFVAGTHGDRAFGVEVDKVITTFGPNTANDAWEQKGSSVDTSGLPDFQADSLGGTTILSADLPYNFTGTDPNDGKKKIFQVVDGADWVFGAALNGVELARFQATSPTETAYTIIGEPSALASDELIEYPAGSTIDLPDILLPNKMTRWFRCLPGAGSLTLSYGAGTVYLDGSLVSSVEVEQNAKVMISRTGSNLIVTKGGSDPAVSFVDAVAVGANDTSAPLDWGKTYVDARSAITVASGNLRLPPLASGRLGQEIRFHLNPTGLGITARPTVGENLNSDTDADGSAYYDSGFGEIVVTNMGTYAKTELRNESSGSLGYVYGSIDSAAAVGSDWAITKVEGDLAVASNRVTLKAGKTYSLSGGFGRWNAAGNTEMAFAFYDHSAGASFGSEGNHMGAGIAASSIKGTADAVITPLSDLEVSIRTNKQVGGGSISSQGNDVFGGTFLVREIQTTKVFPAGSFKANVGSIFRQYWTDVTNPGSPAPAQWTATRSGPHILRYTLAWTNNQISMNIGTTAGGIDIHAGDAVRLSASVTSRAFEYDLVAGQTYHISPWGGGGTSSGAMLIEIEPSVSEAAIRAEDAPVDDQAAAGSLRVGTTLFQWGTWSGVAVDLNSNDVSVNIAFPQAFKTLPAFSVSFSEVPTQAWTTLGTARALSTGTADVRVHRIGGVGGGPVTGSWMAIGEAP